MSSSPVSARQQGWKHPCNASLFRGGVLSFFTKVQESFPVLGALLGPSDLSGDGEGSDVMGENRMETCCVGAR